MAKSYLCNSTVPLGAFLLRPSSSTQSNVIAMSYKNNKTGEIEHAALRQHGDGRWAVEVCEKPIIFYLFVMIFLFQKKKGKDRSFPTLLLLLQNCEDLTVPKKRNIEAKRDLNIETKY